MATTIQVSEDLRKELLDRKLSKEDTFEEIIWDLLEDTMELSEQTKKDIEEARKQIKRGEFVTLERLKKDLSLK